MMKGWRAVGAVAVFLAVASVARANVKLGSLFQDHMVLQRGQEVNVWGTADPGEEVTVTLAEQSKRATADAKGKWVAKLGVLQAGGPWQMEVKGKNTVKLQDVLVGEVWVCSGQSNMDMQVVQAKDGLAEASKADWPQIRLFKVPIRPAASEQEETGGQWVVCTSKAVGDFSAAGYYFGREIHQKLNVPVGLIQSAVGGTPAESWTPEEELAKHAETKPILDQWAKDKAAYPQRKAEYDKAMSAWQEKYQQEPADTGLEKGWAKAEFDDKTWPTMAEPWLWQRQGLKHNGTVWFRREVKVPAEWAGKDLVLELGRIDDRDQTYFNGQLVGQTWKDNPLAVFVHRKYTIPAKMVKGAPAVIAVRVWDVGGDGGFDAEPGEMQLHPAQGLAEPLHLEGPWKYQVEKAIDVPPAPLEPRGPGNAWTPAALWDGMIRPLVPYGIRGVIWYQGESNADRAEQYQTLFPSMIKAWRQAWGEGEFPFLYVQLANFSNWKADPTEPAASTWAELREAQLMTLKLENTGMAVTADIGDATDIHPKNKQEVGRRLSLVALEQVYGRDDLAFTGPMLESVQIEGQRVRLRFRPGAEKLEQHGDRLGDWAVAGEDHKFHRARAQIEGVDEVVLFCNEVKRPVAVRYGWADDPHLGLYNSAGLPASPFRTDTWQGVTAGKR